MFGIEEERKARWAYRFNEQLKHARNARDGDMRPFCVGPQNDDWTRLFKYFSSSSSTRERCFLFIAGDRKKHVCMIRGGAPVKRNPATDKHGNNNSTTE